MDINGRTAHRGELDGLPALEDRVDKLGAQDAEVHETTDIAPSYAVALRQFPEPLGAASTRKPKWRGHLSENALGLMRRACRLFSHHSDQTA